MMIYDLVAVYLGMQLDEFITETLKALVKGVKDAQAFAKDNGARINPVINGGGQNGRHVKIGSSENATTISNIDFDVAVTASTKQESGISGGINVLSLTLGGKAADTDVHQTVSRIKVTIQAALPSTIPYD